MIALDGDQAGDLDGVVGRLVAVFSPPLRPDEVEACVVDASAAFENARVRQFLPVLIERAATDSLRAAARAASRSDGLPAMSLRAAPAASLLPSGEQGCLPVRVPGRRHRPRRISTNALLPSCD